MSYIEGACIEVNVNLFEGDPKVKIECIKHYKPVCRVCTLDFSEMYGEIGKGFIHFHHVTPISEVGSVYKVDL